MTVFGIICLIILATMLLSVSVSPMTTKQYIISAVLVLIPAVYVIATLIN